MAVKKMLSAKISRLLIIAVLMSHTQQANGSITFKSDPVIITKGEFDILNAITPKDWTEATERGIESDNQEKSLETNLLNANVVVQNGSISHVQLLDTLPDDEAHRDSCVADQILKSALHIYNSRCAPNAIEGSRCESFLSDKELPADSKLARECENVIRNRRNSHSSFRRLLPRNYRDGFYEMFENLPAPLDISREFCNCKTAQNQRILKQNDNQQNLAVVQWAQFIGNDLSKPVVTAMSNGASIECCNKQSYRLQPRYDHPACEPLTASSTAKFGVETCLNYVRSALAVGSKCTFGAPEQLNQATGILDLSPLYGFTDTANRRMRLWRDGLLNSTSASDNNKNELLPLVTQDRHLFCVPAADGNNANSTCFIAGDSRVNSNPFAVVIHTLFMRNHNRLARSLKQKFPQWSDEQLFKKARDINTDIYRSIVFNEWLPLVVGAKKAKEIRSENSNAVISDYKEISNAYAVAASRFYHSMLPDALQGTQANGKVSNNVEMENDLFILKDVLYNGQYAFTSEKVTDILKALLHQKAMKMDAVYEESLIIDFVGNKRPTHGDMLAFDIQRGRDHGLQPYYKYLEVCNAVQVTGWNSLNRFIAPKTLDMLKEIYKNWEDIDLIVGGISELPASDATVGPTFQCIMGEQFARLHQWHQQEVKPSSGISMEFLKYKLVKAAELLCLNDNVEYVPSNIFEIASDRNPLLSCADVISRNFRTP